MLPSRIYLIGLMGAGKSTVGKHLAALLNYPFLDTDHEIEKNTGASIAWIFEIEGEAGFREREELEIDALTQQDPLVLATGGGVVLSAKNREHLKSRGCVVYLKASAELLYRRTSRDRSRPLLQTKDRRAVISRLLKEREPLYLQTADLVLDTKEASAKEMAKKIIEHLECGT